MISALLLVTVGGIVAWILSSPSSRTEYREIQLTTNSSEAHVTAAAIAPDGKYIAFADSSGLYLRVIDSGETHALPGPEGGLITRIAWFADGTKLVVSGEGAVDNPRPTIWSVSVLAGRARPLRRDAAAAAVSPDGSRIVFLEPSGAAIWTMGPNGEEPRRVVAAQTGESFALPSFWWDGSRLTYGRIRLVEQTPGARTLIVSAETRDDAGHTAVLLADPGLRGATRLPDGRVLYSLDTGAPWNPGATTLWETRADPSTGHPIGTPRRIAGPYSGVSLTQFSRSLDGRRVTFLKSIPQKDVYVADLVANDKFANPRRLTLDDSNDIVNNWTADGRAVLFTSNRNGTIDIFQQPLDGGPADAILSGPDDEKGVVAVDARGGWLYYLLAPPEWRAVGSRINGDSVMRISAAGGPPEKVADGTHHPFVVCSRGPANRCALIEYEGGRLIVYDMNANQGKGARLVSTAVPFPEAPYGSDLSPDGSRLAIRIGTEGRIRVVSLDGQLTQDITVTGGHLDPVTPYWAADGKGFYIPSTSTTRTPPGTDLLFIDLHGLARVVWHQGVCDWGTGIPSPDGRHIAFVQSSELSNVWMLEGS